MPPVAPRLGYRVRMLAKGIDALITEHLDHRYGMSLREGLVLVTLRREPATHAQDLVVMTGIDKSQVSRCVEALVQRGCIHPEKAAADQRYKTYRFSVDGAALADAVDADLAAFNRQALAPLSGAEATTLLALLQRVSENLEAPACWSDEPALALPTAAERLTTVLYAWRRGA